MRMWTALVGVAVFLGIILALAVFLPMGRAFSRELRYLNMKLMNSRSDKEQAYWEKRKKSLWLCHGACMPLLCLGGI